MNKSTFMKSIKTVAIVGVLGMLAACGQRVEIPPANVGKIQTKDGMQEGVRHPSKFRLDRCWSYCDKLITLDVSDQRYNESFKTFMPKDDLNLSYSVSMTLSVDPKKYDFIFSNVIALPLSDQTAEIKQIDVYQRYAEAIVETTLPEIVANFEIAEISSSRTEVNNYIQKRLNDELSKTPFVLKYVGLTNVDYPKIITDAKENAAERREKEQQILAQRTLDLLEIETERQVEEKRREVELMKAASKRMIAKEMMSKEYETLLKYETLNAIAASPNKVIVPTDALSSLAVQSQVK